MNLDALRMRTSSLWRAAARSRTTLTRRAEGDEEFRPHTPTSLRIFVASAAASRRPEAFSSFVYEAWYWLSSAAWPSSKPNISDKLSSFESVF
jgi:hypothetical protein